MSIDDAAPVRELSAQLGYEASLETTRTRIEQLTANRRNQAAFVAIVNGDVAGWIEVAINFHLQSDPHAVIGGLVVREDMRSQGIGRRLVAEAEKWSRKQGITVLRVRSQIKREDAHRFYLREGFRQVKT